eukprot:4539397-Pyramimonas_sp.AAC.1
MARKMASTRGAPRTRRTHYINQQSDWWRRLATTLRAHLTSRQRGHGVRQQHQLEAAARQLVYEGIPTGGARLNPISYQH